MNPLSRKNLITLLSAFPASTLFAWAVWRMNLHLVSSTFGRTYELFDLFGFFLSLALLYIAAVEWRARADKRDLTGYLPTLLFLLTAFALLSLRTAYPSLSIDYRCFARGAQNLALGLNPYFGTKFEYPPLFAQCLVGSHALLIWAATLLHLDTSPEGGWRILYFIYYAAHFGAMLCAYLMTHRLGQRIGFREPVLSLLCAGLFLFSVPMMQNLQFNQTNIFILDILLVILLLPPSRNLASGLLAALGTAFKLYPILVLVPWIRMRRFRAIAAMAMGGAALLCLETRGFRDWHIISQYLSFFFHDYPKYIHYRNNCYYSLFANVLSIIKFHVIPMGRSAFLVFSGTLPMAATLLTLVWFGVRGLKRERSFESALHYGSERDAAQAERERRWLLDMLPLMLLVSPTLWAHHFILIIPFVMQALFDAKQKSPMRIGLFTGLIFLPPVFDIFPFSYHRLAGLIGLCLSAPMTLTFSEPAKASVPRD